MVDSRLPTTRIADRYEPTDVLGRGGEATVLKAVDTRHQRIVALKVRPLPPTGATDELLNEARALLSLPPHPGLAHARDDLLTADQHVLVLDWVEGIDLGRVLSEEGRPGLPVTTVLRWSAQVAEALTALHRHGVVHGDIKPANLVLDGAGRVVVVDLGSSSAPLAARTAGGTAGFRAPEVAAGEPPTRASDVFSLAATAFALLHGDAPTGGSPRWNGIDPRGGTRLESALRAGLSIDPVRRPSTPGELVELLRSGWDDRTPTGVVTVLLTDVVSSSTLWRDRPDRVPAMLAEVQLIVDRSTEAHGGRRVGGAVEGDATMSVFDRAGDALLAAVQMQHDVHARPGPALIRAGLATGEVVDVDGELLGPTVNRAARVRELARTGEVLLSSSTASIVRSAPPPDVGLLALGNHQLHGFDDADDLFAVIAPGVAAPPDPARSPYPGLASFTRHDADLFVGREAAIERCLTGFETNRFVAVVGASGSGKTSLVLAGLAPRLARAQRDGGRFDVDRDDRDGVVVVRPGGEPNRVLDDALPPHDAVLIVDQLEELVTLCHDPEDRQVFVDRIVSHPGGLVVSLRADLYGEFGVYPELAARLAASQLLLGPLARDDVLRAVLEPAAKCGLTVEDGLADLIAEELGEAPGALPLLGHALREAWLRRDGRTITIAGYRASGGVRSAIATTAERAYDALDGADRAVARNVLLRMVELRHDGDDVRRWTSYDEIGDAGAGEVVQALARSRLLVIDGDHVTVVHEALLRAWPRLNEWIAEERVDLIARQELRWAAARWDAGGRDQDDLPRGVRLESVLDVAAAHSLHGVELEFVDAARRLHDRQASDDRRRTRRLRTLATAASVLAVAAVIVGAVAVVQRRDAQQARTAADAAAVEADAAAADADDSARDAQAAAARADEQRDAADAATRDAQIQALVGRAESLRSTQRDTSALLAAEAFRLADTPETRSALFSTFTAGDGFLDAHHLGDEVSPRGSQGIVMPDGVTAFYVDRDGRPRPYDLGTGALGDPLPVIVEPGDANSELASSDDGRLLAQAARHGTSNERTTTLAVFDVTTGALRHEPIERSGWASSIEFVDDGRSIAVIWAPSGDVTTFDTATGTELASAPAGEVDPTIFYRNAVLLVGGDLVATSTGAGQLRILDPVTLAERRTIDIPVSTAGVVGNVGDGTIITAGDRGLNRVDLVTGGILWHHDAEASCDGLVIAAESERFFCGNQFGRLEERDLGSGIVVRRLGAQNGNAGRLFLADGGRTLVSFRANEPAVARWRLDGSGPITHVIAPGFDPERFDPTGRRIVVSRGDDEDFETRVVDVASGEIIRDLGQLSGQSWVDADTIGGVLPNAEGLLQTVEVDIDGGEATFLDLILDPPPVNAAIDSGKDVVLLQYGERESHPMDVQVLRLGSGELGPIISAGRGSSIAVSGSGHRVVAGSIDDLAVDVYDGWTGDRVGQVPGDGAFVTAADQLFTTTFSGALTLYDLETLERVRTIGGSLGYIQRVVGTTDGSTIAANGGDHLVTLFDVESGRALGTPLRIADDEFNNGALSPEGSWLALAGGGGTLVWSLDPHRWLDAACEVAGRDLTRDEWDANIGDLAPYRRTCAT